MRLDGYRRGVDDELGFDVPAELEPGVFADGLVAWIAPHQIVLDFTSPTSGDSVIATARIGIPATATLEVLRSLTECIGRYELQFGEIHEPRRVDEGWLEGSG